MNTVYALTRCWVPDDYLWAKHDAEREFESFLGWLRAQPGLSVSRTHRFLREQRDEETGRVRLHFYSQRVTVEGSERALAATQEAFHARWPEAV